MITHDSTGVGYSSATGTTSATWQHVIGASATALIVGITFTGAPSSVSRTVKVGTKTLSSLGFREVSGTQWVELFGVLAPPIGAQSVLVTTSTSTRMVANSVSYNGVVSFGASATNVFSAGAPFISVTRSVDRGNWLFGVFAAAGTAALTSDEDIQRYNRSSMAIMDDVGTTSVTSLMLDAPLPVAVSAVSASMVPVSGATGVSHTGKSSLALSASPSAEATNNPAKIALAPLAVTATASATITAFGQKSFAAQQSVTATPTASATATTSIAASLALTATANARPEPSLWIFNSSLSVLSSRTASATVTPAPPVPPVASSPLRYVGRYPDTQGSLAPRSYALAAAEKVDVRIDSVAKEIDSQVYTLASIRYVDQQDALRAQKTAVTAADEAYFPATNHNLATLDSTGFVPTGMYPPNVISNRTSKFYESAASGGTVSTAGYRSLLLGTVTIPDPGYPYVVLPFAWVSGSDPYGTAVSRWVGTGSTGKLVVMPTTGGDVIYGWGICAGSSSSSAHPVTPAASMGVTAQKVFGSLTLGLYGSVMVEAPDRSYTFGGGTFYVIIMPAV